MTNEDTFLSALHETPSDEVTWLALADWLEEDGQSERAEVVRLTRRLRTLPVMKRTKARATLEDRLAALLNAGVRPVVAEVVNSIGMRLALIPPGRFRMGSLENEKERSDDEAAHEVEITRPFYLGVYAVTQRQWKAVMGNNPSYFSREGDGKDEVKDVNDEELAEFPVEQVSWEDAQTFLKKLSERPEERERGIQYQLPTEAEWEYSCRGGACSTTPFHFGTTLSSTQANFHGEYPYGDAEKGQYLGRTCRVGSYLPNVFGLYDMHGHVWEWCQDWYGEYQEGAQTDPVKEETGSYRVLRGGSWLNYGRYCRAANRFGYAPGDRYQGFGFRVALVPLRDSSLEPSQAE